MGRPSRGRRVVVLYAGNSLRRTRPSRHAQWLHAVHLGVPRARHSPGRRADVEPQAGAARGRSVASAATAALAGTPAEQLPRTGQRPQRRSRAA